MVGALWAPTEWATIYINYSTAFETPTTTEFANPLGGGFNADLGTQQANSFELGFKGQLPTAIPIDEVEPAATRKREDRSRNDAARRSNSIQRCIEIVDPDDRQRSCKRSSGCPLSQGPHRRLWLRHNRRRNRGATKCLE
jgi:hypothetical protein